MTTISPVAINGFENAEYFDVASEAVADSFRIFVSKPAFADPEISLPAIIVLDANMMFGTAREIVGALSMSGDVPAHFVIGIGYKELSSAFTRRASDFTPDSGGEIEAATAMGPPNFGGAANFARFIREELLPLVANLYPIDTDCITLAGTSFGGLFTLWSLLTQEVVVSNYIAISPSIWWDNEAVWDWEAELAATATDVKAKVFITAGGLETQAENKASVDKMIAGDGPLKAHAEKMKAAYDLHGWPRMSEITPEFTEKLRSRGYPGLNIRCNNLPDETHMSIPAAGFSRGIRYLFGD